jgi:fucose 4-O-acetylase-like acetyltransferase
MILWECALPLFQESTRVKKMLIIAAAFAVSLFVGNDQNISYLLSLSRVLVLFPFFILGYYFRHSGFFHALGDHAYRASRHFIRLRTVLGLLVVMILFGLLKARTIVNPKWLYDSYSYDDLNYNIWIRGIFMVCALIITAFLLLSVPNIHIPVITRIGEHTLPIFLMHGFCIKLIDYYHLFDHIVFKQVGVLLLTIAITCLFSSQIVNKLLDPLLKFSGQKFLRLVQNSIFALQHVLNSFLALLNGKSSLSYHHS